MQRYVAISSGDRFSISVVIKTVLGKPYGNFNGLVAIGDLRKYKKVADDMMSPLPFSCYVDNLDDLSSAEREGERYIFFDIESEMGEESSILSVKIASEIIFNGLSYAMVTCPDNSNMSLFDVLCEISSSKRAIDMLSSGSANIFMPKRSSIKEAMNSESIIDSLINIESLFVSGFFDRSKPIAISSDKSAAIKLVSVVEEVRRIAMNVLGPYTPEEAFLRARRGEFSAVFSLSGEEALDALDSDDSLIVTWGLPFIRIGTLFQGNEGEIGFLERAEMNMERALRLSSEISEKGVWA